MKEHIGQTISGAYVAVAPWRLLQALNNRLDTINQSNRIALKLLHNDEMKIGRKIEEIPIGQPKAIEMSLNNPITVIWGPPGTGKTYTIAKLATMLLEKNQSVLLVSHSDISVDGMISEVYKQITEAHPNLYSRYVKKGQVLRYGYVRNEVLSKNEEIVSFNVALNDNLSLKLKRELLLKEKALYKNNKYATRFVEIERELKTISTEVRIKERTYAQNAKVLATTISKVSIDSIFDEKKYDVVIFDEVSMAYVPQIIEAAMFAQKHFVCVGDFRQLASIAQFEAARVLEKDIFMYLGIIDELSNLHYHPWLVMLNEQRRMHPEIAKFSSEQFYLNLLKNHSSVYENRNGIVRKQPFQNHAVTLIDLADTYSLCSKTIDNSRFNIFSAIVSFQTAIDALNSGQNSIGIITPYQAQSRLIQAMIHDYGLSSKGEIVCSTVHQFQGSERDVIIFDAVESYPFVKPGILMRSNENDSLVRLINVAVTRAKGKFITVANVNYWQNKFKNLPHVYCSLLNYIQTNGNVVSNKNSSLDNHLECDRSKKNIRCYGRKNDYKKAFLYDIKHASSSITICLPEGILDEEFSKIVFDEIKKCIDSKMEVLIKSNDYKKLPQMWKDYCYASEETMFPLILIDGHILWYGALMAKGILNDKDHKYFGTLNVVYRLNGAKAVDVICSLTDIDYRIVNKERKVFLMKDPHASVEVINENGKQIVRDGLALYVHHNVKCPKCNKSMDISYGMKNKPFLKCSACGNTELLDVNIVNKYIEENNVRCPDDNGGILAKVSYKGIYIVCENGHFVNIRDI